MNHLQMESRNMSSSTDYLLVVLSHGYPNGLVTSDQTRMNIQQDIIPIFDGENCPAMQGKPKVFIIQACRGTITKVPPPSCRYFSNGEYLCYPSLNYWSSGLEEVWL